MDIPWELGLHDADPDVRREALWAAGWTRQPWLLDHCRGLASDVNAKHCDALYLLCVLGTESDLERIISLGHAVEMGPQRFRLLGAYGHPTVLEVILQALQNGDPRVSVAASAAFTKVTGFDIESDIRVELPPEDGSEPDDFEREFLDDAFLPDVERARRHWADVRKRLSGGTRWCRGLDLSQAVSEEVLCQLDLESRWEACFRGKYEGWWEGSPIDLEIFPQKSRWRVA